MATKCALGMQSTDPNVKCQERKFNFFGVLYVGAQTYTCTDIFLTETAEDSTLNSRELSCHRLTTDLVCKIAFLNIFKIQLQ